MAVTFSLPGVTEQRYLVVPVPQGITPTQLATLLAVGGTVTIDGVLHIVINARAGAHRGGTMFVVVTVQRRAVLAVQSDWVCLVENPCTDPLAHYVASLGGG